jgi:1-acyl-sn-glycerol-3-phosphate acyltransferase
VGTSEIFGKGFMRRLARSIKVVVDPDANLVPAMRAGAFGLRHGLALVLYPEGERSIDGKPRIFKKGAAILSIHLQVPIVPVAIASKASSKCGRATMPFADSSPLEDGLRRPHPPPPESEASEAALRKIDCRPESAGCRYVGEAAAELVCCVSPIYEQIFPCHLTLCRPEAPFFGDLCNLPRIA